MSLAAGTRLGSYEVVGPLGAGGMGEVYLATDTRLGREVAIKVLPPDMVTDRDRLMRFEREAKAVSALNHPHIVTLYEVGTSDSGPYIAMERIDGRSIHELLIDGLLPVRRLLVLGTQIAEGLAKAHAAGIVHRDLKPGNVMVTSDGFAKILDFGLAKLVYPELDANAMDATTKIGKDTASGMVLGTIGYLSPEQASGKPVDYRADQFALGALLYEMATRVRPFRRATLVESLAATISDDVEPLRSKRPDVPAPLEWLIDRCLSKDPGDRYASTSDLARELASLRDHLSDLTRMPSDVTPVGRGQFSRRWKTWTVAIFAAAGVGIAGFIAAKLTTDVSVPSYKPLTFRRGMITGARFGPDGKTIYYSAAYGGGPSRIYVTHLDRPESRPLDVPPGFLLAVSAKQDLAILQTDGRSTYSTPGTLVRVPAIGGTPRPLVENATYADWAPDGEQLAVIRENGGRCEFPIGRSIAPQCGMIRVSPKGDRVAFSRGGGRGGLEIVDLAGRGMVSHEMPNVFGLAWAPDGQEVWFTGSETGSAHDRALYALSLSGARRLVARVAGAMSVYDVAPDGRGALIATGAGWVGINASGGEGTEEQSLDMLGRSEIAGLSADGKWLLINETREVGTGAYLRSTDGKAPIHFEGVVAYGLSPDGASVLVHPRLDRTHPQLLPRGPGQSRALSLDAGLELAPGQIALWSRNGRRLFAWMRPERADDPTARLYVRNDEGPWKALTPPTLPGRFAVSPDGNTVAIVERAGTVTLISIQGGPPRPLDGERGTPIHWSADGHLFLSSRELFPARLYRRNLTTGQVEPWRAVSPADSSGVMLVSRMLMANDDKFLVYQYGRALNDLYLVRDVR